MSSMDLSKVYKTYSFLLTAEKLPVNKDIFLDDLGYLAQNFEDFLHSESNVTSNRSDIVPKLAELIVNFGLVKTFNLVEDRDYDAKDFPTEAADAEECFEHLSYLIKQYEKIDTAGKRKFLIQVILLCATHSSEFFWSSKKSVSSSQEFLNKLLVTSGHDNLSMLLCDETFYPTIFKAVLKWMRPVLKQDSWMKNPSYCYVFHWLLSHVKHPHLMDYYNDVMPPPFMFTNYYGIPQQVIGIKCFDHILDNMPPSLFKSNGVEDAIYDTLKKYTHSKDIPVIEVLYPCLLKLPMMNLQKVNHLQWFQFDTVLQELLTNIDVECNPKLRHTYLIQMHLFIKCTPCFKHLKESIRILLENFTANSLAEDICRITSLKILKELIRSCWARMENYCCDVMLAILKTVYDVENPEYTSENILTEETLTLCKECLLLLKHACPGTFDCIVSDYLEDESLPGVSLLQSIS